MVDSINSSIGQRKLADLQAKVASMEKTVMALAQGVNQAFIEINGTISHIQAVLDATTEEVGTDVIQARLDAKELAERRSYAEQVKAKVKELEVNGKIAKADTIEEGVTVVGVEKDKEGNVLPPEYVQFAMDPKMQGYDNVKGLLGLGVGARTEIPPDGTFIEVTAIYKPVAPAVDQAQAG